MSAPAPMNSAADPGVRLLVEGGDAVLEGVIVDGDREEGGQWDLDSRFVLLTEDGQRVVVNGWIRVNGLACLTEVDEDQGEEGQG